MSVNYPSEIQEMLRLGEVFDRDSEAGHGHSIPLNLPVVAVSGPANLPDFNLPNFKKELIIYPAIFLAAFIFFFSVLNFSSLSAQVSGWFAKPQEEQILGEDLSEYYKWIGGYFFSVGDTALLGPNNDLDKDGLTNIDEWTIRTNPTIADSDSDGFSDGIEVINSYNPWGAGRMTERQKKLAEGLDLIRVNNRISYNASAVLTQPQVLAAQIVNYDLERSGTLSVPKLNLQVPVIWSKDPSDFDDDLKKGVIHYPGTAMPGEKGIVYISGHSSDYIWKRNQFGQVFAKLNALDAGDDIFLDLYDTNGKVYNFRYKVSGKGIYKPDDQTQFIDSSVQKLNLSTCWPIGTSKDRLVVSAVATDL